MFAGQFDEERELVELLEVSHLVVEFVEDP